MSKDIEQLLRDSLAAHARTAPDAPELAEPVIKRGTTIRRRRRVAGVAAAAVATVGVTGAVWSVVGPGAHDELLAARQGATTSSTGPVAVVPRADLTGRGVVLVTPTRSVPLDASVRSVRSVLPAGKGTLVLTSTQATAAATGGTQRLVLVPPSGEPRIIAEGSISSFAVNADGSRVAYAGGPAGATNLQPRVRELATGQLVSSTGVPGVGALDIAAWDGTAVLLGARAGGSTWRWTPGSDPTRVEGATRAVAVPGAAPVLVVSADGRECLRRANAATDLLCGQGLQVTVSPDGAQGLARTTKGAATLARLDLKAGTATNLTMPTELTGEGAAVTDLAHAAWTKDGVPLLPLWPAGKSLADADWSSLDIRTGALAEAVLPPGAERTIRW